MNYAAVVSSVSLALDPGLRQAGIISYINNNVTSMNHLMEDISNIKFRKLRKNKSDEDAKSLRKALIHNKQSIQHISEVRFHLVQRFSFSAKC